MTFPWAKVMRFGIVGGGVTLLNYVLSLAMIAGGHHYLVATATGWAVGVAVSYVFNKYFTFLRSDRPGAREVGSFLAGYVLQLLIGSMTLVFLVDVAGIPFKLAFFLNVIVTALFSYIFMDRIVFTWRSQRAR